MKNYKVKLVAGANGAAPTATLEERSVTQAAGDALTTLIKDDEGTIGYVGNVVRAGLVYGMGVFAKYRQTGQMSWNPF